MNVSILLSLIALTGALTACDQVNSIVDRQSEELRQNIADKEESFRPLAGEYQGTLLNTPKSEPQPVVLVLLPTTIPVQNPGRNDISHVPSLGGTLSVVYTSDDGEESLIPIAHYDSTLWDAETSRLRLNGTMQTASAGGIQVYLDGVVEQERIVARIHSSLKGYVGTIDVTRVADIPEESEVSNPTH